MTKNQPIQESDLRMVWGTCPEPKFDQWMDQHGDVIAKRAAQVEKRITQRRLLMRVMSLSAALATCLLVTLALTNRLSGPAFAQAIEHVHAAKSIVWKHDFYMRATSTDEKRTWLHKMSSLRYYQPPGLYRIEELNGTGDVVGITIRDLKQGRELLLSPRTRKAKLAEIDVQRGNTGPLKWILESMEEHPLEMLPARSTSTDDVVNIFRRVLRGKPGMEDRYLDYWIDPTTKQLVQFRNGIEHPLEPEIAPDRRVKGEKTWKGARALGTIESNFELNKKLPRSLFSLRIPSGYDLEISDEATISESEVIEYLTAAVEFSDNKFPESASGMFLDQDKYDAIFDKPKSEWSKAERRIADTVKQVMLGTGSRGGVHFPLMQYVREHTVPGSFRYIGKGVTLGENERIVCWYQLKETTDFRAIYSDLSVRNVLPDQLPLPVDAD